MFGSVKNGLIILISNMTKEGLINRVLECNCKTFYIGFTKWFCFSKANFKKFLTSFIDDEEKLKCKKDPFDYQSIKELKKGLTTFELTPVEGARYDTFCKNHRHKDVEMGAIGGGTSITFSPNSIGHCVKCKCHICGQTADITDNDSW